MKLLDTPWLETTNKRARMNAVVEAAAAELGVSVVEVMDRLNGVALLGAANCTTGRMLEQLGVDPQKAGKKARKALKAPKAAPTLRQLDQDSDGALSRIEAESARRVLAAGLHPGSHDLNRDIEKYMAKNKLGLSEYVKVLEDAQQGRIRL